MVTIKSFFKREAAANGLVINQAPQRSQMFIAPISDCVSENEHRMFSKPINLLITSVGHRDP
jgi:hypothetical protein